MKFESFEEFCVDKLKELSKKYPKEILNLHIGYDPCGDMEYICWCESGKHFEDEDYLTTDNMVDWTYDSLALFDDSCISLYRNLTKTFIFRDGVVYPPNTKF